MTELSLKVFCSYSHKDEHLREELDKHLSPFIHSGLISTWSDRKILPGEVWDDEIKHNLKTADIILLLISADFLASKYCWEVEVNTAIERHKAKEACVIPIILRSVYWKYPPLSLAQIQALPKNATPVMSSSWHNQDEAFTNVVEGIWNSVEKLKRNREERQREQETERLRQQEAVSLQIQREQEEAERLRQQQETERLKRPKEEAQRRSQETDDLSSDKGVDYRHLRDLLKARKWKEADQETLQVMLKVAGREKEGWLDTDSIAKFPCTDLRTIDQLWVRYSHGRFGFSVQKKIWLEVGGKWNAFYSRVGWQVSTKWFLGGWVKEEGIKYDFNSPEGHLPYLPEGKGMVMWVTWDVVCGMVSSLASRLVKCNI
ncbi:GUN4 domain-containing protein [Aliinostoc sp. HNIBRCY26]|uniref:GUN4 domain-containing protein n=1 Tax=Aliinostoc sp. HNIBRCY26 TaxID=3418997 RepID=UPI003CFF7261